ncbi:respiratory nitrate reductase subunit gamma [Propionimicrobium lymphophilum]|uniref:respiratory nitrate reductase subunit gamma n=1 Tax=Propionimicrobium TaxID=203133 RepID=UPI0003D79844|nr:MULTISPECIES: respiratory nitrate reductase subunit gamma [Propionimicrobium]ETJ98101.1 respiratory nitrate reductase, gamma subunit [Propionimicrobium sp. BV2F7]MDK7710797.1 respiratory nitrate reductase subunit gamma [Propionimicrobium lymphophilum]MDK7734586.1 respiratory nitrate reductase subunit gamma [Propionimicrobium lymphophilum]
MSAFETFFWMGFPYLALVMLIVGLVWRYRYDKFGWTSRSSQLQESALLRWASPMFHFGILFVGLGHVMGLLIPKSWTEALGVSNHAYHFVATIGGAAAGVMTIVGLIGLLYRRLVTKSVRFATTKNDIFMYVLLCLPIGLGFWATLQNQILGVPGGYDYRETISPWLRSILSFQPQPELIAMVPTSFKLHIIAGFLLFAIWPFTRLVHVVSAPVMYPTRPYVVYRSREESIQSTDVPRGWEPVQTRPQNRDSRSQGA